MASVFEKVGKKVKDALSSSGKQTKQSVASSNKALTGTRNDKATTTSTNKVTTKNVNTGANLVNQSSTPDLTQAINKVASEVAKPIATGTVQPIRRVDPVKVAPIGGQDKPVISTPRVGSIDISKLQGNKALDSTAMQSIMANNSEKRNEHQRPVPSIGERNTDGLDIGAEQANKDNAIRDAQLAKNESTGTSAYDLGKVSQKSDGTSTKTSKYAGTVFNGVDVMPESKNKFTKAVQSALTMEGEKQGRVLKANADGSAPKGAAKGDVIVSDGWTRTVKDVDSKGNPVFEKGYATGSDAIDARMLSQDDKYMVDKYQREWSAFNDAYKQAMNIGDTASAEQYKKGMDEAHRKAEDVRKRYGYSGGSAGAGYKSKDKKNVFDNPEEEQKTSSVSAMDRFKEFARLATNADIGEAKAKEDRQNDYDLVDQLEKKAMSQDYEGDTNVGLMTQEGRDAERAKVGSNTKTETRTWNLPGQDPITVETQIANGNAGGGSLTRDGKLWDFGGKDVIDDTAIELMTGKEKRTYATIYKTEGADKAREYLDALSRVRLNERAQQKEAQDAAQFGADHQAIASVASPLLNATAGTVAGATNAVYSLGNTLYNMSGGKIPTYHTIDPNAAYNRYADLGSQTRQGVIESIDTGNKTVDAILGFLYEGGESMLDMAANTALFGGIGSKAVTTAMSSQSAQSAWNESLRNGATQEQAAANAFVNGLLEYVSETPAVEGMFDIGAGKLSGKSVKDRMKILFGEQLTEGGGEGFANISQTYADHVIMGDKSTYSQVANSYMEQGYDEKTANAMAVRDLYGLETIKSIGQGMLVGGGMGGAAMGMNMYNTHLERGNKLSTKDENGQPVYANSATVRDIADTGAKIAEDLGLEERFQKTIEKLKSQSEGGKITHTKDNRVGIIELADLKGAIQEKCREQAAKDINEFYNYVGLSASDVPHEMARHLGRFTGSDTTGFGNRKFSKAWEKKASEVGTDIDFLMFDPNQTGYSENYVKLMVDKANQYKDMTPEQLFEEQQRIEEEANQFYEMSTILNYAGVLNDEQQGLSNYVRSQVNKYLNGYEASAGGTSPVATDDDDIYDISQIAELDPEYQNAPQGEVVTDTTTPTEAATPNTVNMEDDTQSDTTDTSADTVSPIPSTAHNNVRRGLHKTEIDRMNTEDSNAIKNAVNMLKDDTLDDFDIVQYDSDIGDVILTEVDDFNGNTEPKVVRRVTIRENGDTNYYQYNGEEIIPDKSNYVSDDYTGFDVSAQREHEKIWKRSGRNYDAIKINNTEYFNKTFGDLFTEPEQQTESNTQEPAQPTNILIKSNFFNGQVKKAKKKNREIYVENGNVVYDGTPYTAATIDEVIEESDTAVHVKLKTVGSSKKKGGWDVWIPKDCIRNENGYYSYEVDNETGNAINRDEDGKIVQSSDQLLVKSNFLQQQVKKAKKKKYDLIVDETDIDGYSSVTVLNLISDTGNAIQVELATRGSSKNKGGWTATIPKNLTRNEDGYFIVDAVPNEEAQVEEQSVEEAEDEVAAEAVETIIEEHEEEIVEKLEETVESIEEESTPSDILETVEEAVDELVEDVATDDVEEEVKDYIKYTLSEGIVNELYDEVEFNLEYLIESETYSYDYSDELKEIRELVTRDIIDLYEGKYKSDDIIDLLEGLNSYFQNAKEDEEPNLQYLYNDILYDVSQLEKNDSEVTDLADIIIDGLVRYDDVEVRKEEFRKMYGREGDIIDDESTEDSVREEEPEDNTGSEGQSRPDTRTDESEQVTAEEEADTGNESETEGQVATETEPVSDVSEEAEENNEVEETEEAEEQQAEEPVEKTPKQKAQDRAKELADGRKNRSVTKRAERTYKDLKGLCRNYVEQNGITNDVEMYIPLKENETLNKRLLEDLAYLNKKEKELLDMDYKLDVVDEEKYNMLSNVIDMVDMAISRAKSDMDANAEADAKWNEELDQEVENLQNEQNEEYNEDTEETDVTTEGEEDGLQEDDRDVHSGKSEGSKSGKSDGTGRKGGSSKSGGRTSGRGKRNGTQSESEDDRGTDGIQQDEADAGTEPSESIGNDRDDEAASTGDREGQSAAESEQPVYERYYTDRGVDLSKKKPIIRANSNIEALRLYKDILNDGRKATLEEKQILAQYSGWGGIKDAFVGDKPEFESIREELRSLLTDREYIMASQSSSTAFFTPYEMIDGIYSIVNQLGMGNGVRVLEPSCGSGNFLGCMPSTMRENSSITAVELDAISADIASIVYDDVDVRHQNFKNFDDEHGIGLVVGNVPFGETTMSQTGVVNGKQKIHDFFINKSLSMVEDGGIVAVLTTHGTLDKATTDAREEMAEKANLLAAVRFPSGTFGSTNVISDLLIFQKKGEFVDDSYAQDFVKTVKTNGTTVSSYFVNHPEMVLGRMVPATNQFGDATIDVKSDGRTLEDVMSYIPTSVVSEQALRKLNDARKKAQQAKAEHDALDDAPHNVAEGTLRKIDGKMYTCHKGKWKPYEYRTNNGTGTVNERKTRLASEMYDLLQDLEELLEFERTTESDALVDKKIEELNKKYDAFIKRNVKTTGNKTYLTDDDCKNAYKVDPGNYAKLTLLEKTHKEGRKTVFDKKGDILTKRVLYPIKDITSADNVNDALNICLDAVGSVDMNLIAELCGITKDEAVAGLRGRVYKDPFSEDGRFEVAEEILSGNVREKYRTLKAKKDRTEEEDELLERLFNAIPVDTPHDDIKLQLGVPWLGQEHTQDFIQKICGKNTTVSYNEATGRWNIKYKSDPSVKNKYGIHGKTPLDLIKHIMEGKPLTVYDSPGEINTDKTNAVIARAEMVREEFNTWLWEDEDRKNDIVKRFNERFNSDVARSYDGSYLEFPGMNPNITMNPHQANAVARMLNNRNNLLVHPVGSGKTFTMIAGALEMKRLGIAKKPVMVVPTNKVTDFLEDTYKLYPNAKVFAAEGDMAKGSNLNKLIAQINSEDYDLVILKTTTFRDFPLSPEYVDEYIQKQIAPLEKYYLDNKGSMDKKESDALLKSIESMKESLEASKNKAMETSAEIDVFFDECGFDALFVDECQNYKNLNFMTSMSKVNGVPEFKKDGSGYENLHMHMVTDLLNKRGNRIVFASATPVTNNLTELYNMQRYLQPEVLERLGLEAFDAWANTFGEVSQSVELNSTGTKLVEKLRFSKFNNLPELIRMLSPNFDFVDKGDLNIKLPNATFVDDKSKIEAEPSFILKLFNQAVEERILYDAEDKAAALKAYQDARMAALDIRFVRKKMIDAGLIPADTTDADLDIPGSKVNLCVQNVIDIYNQHNDNKQTQVIFLDSGVPKSKNSKNNTYDFDLYNDIKSKLIAAGIPEKEIAFAQKATTDDAKRRLSENVRSGQVRVLIGSTATAGVGLNLQDRLIAAHHIDAPYRPSDYEQRNGRIIRQGNSNEEVFIYNYSTKNSYDAPMWGMLDRKSKGINAVMSGKPLDRTIEDAGDISDIFSGLSVAAANNPALFELEDAKGVVKKLKGQKAAFTEQKRVRDNIIKNHPKKISDKEKIIQQIEKLQQTVEEHKDDPIKVGDTVYKTQKEASIAVYNAFMKLSDGDRYKGKIMFKVYGHDVMLYTDYNLDGKKGFLVEVLGVPYGTTSYVAYKDSEKFAKKSMPNADIKKFENIYLLAKNSIDNSRSERFLGFRTEELDALNIEYNEALSHKNDVFTKDDELEAAIADVNRLSDQLKKADTGKGKIPYTTYSKDEFLNGPEGYVEEVDEVEEVEEPDEENKNYTAEEARKVATIYREFLSGELVGDHSYVEKYSELYKEYRNNDIDGFNNFYDGVKEIEGINVKTKEDAAAFMVAYSNIRDLDTSLVEKMDAEEKNVFRFAGRPRVYKSQKKEIASNFRRLKKQNVPIEIKSIEDVSSNSLNTRTPADFITSGKMTDQEQRSTFKLDEALEQITDKEREWVRHKREIGDAGIRSVVQEIIDTFGMNYTPNSITRKSVRGWYNLKTNKMFTETPVILGTALHETGHYLDRADEFANENYDAIVQMLDKAPGLKEEFKRRRYSKNEMPFEAVAELAWQWMANPDGAWTLGSYGVSEDHPKNLYESFEEFFPAETLEKMRHIRSILAVYYNASSDTTTPSEPVVTNLDKVVGTSRTRQEARKYKEKNGYVDRNFIQRKRDQILTRLVNSETRFRDFSKKVRDITGKELSRSERVDVALKLLGNYGTMSDALITKGFITPDGTVLEGIGSYASILQRLEKKVLKIDNPHIERRHKVNFAKYFDAYLKAQHALEWEADGKATISRDIAASMSEDSVDFSLDDHADAEAFFKSVIAEVETRYGHVFEEAAQELYAWWNTFVEQWVIPTGRVDPKGWEKLREKYPRYVPMARVMEDFTVSSDITSGRDFIKKAKGSERDTYSPIESFEMMIIKNTKEYYAHHFERTVANIFDTSMDEGGDLGEFVGAFIDEIDPYKTLGRNVNIKQQKQTLKDELVERYLDNIKHDSADGDAVAKEEAKKIADMSEEEVYDYVADRLGFSVMDMILQDNQTEFYKKLRDNLPKEIILVKTGKKYRAFRFKDREMEHALRKLNPGEIHTVAKIMGKFTRTFTALTTSKNFFFAFRNFIRDYQHAYVNDGDYIPGHFTVRTAVALGRSFKNEFYGLIGKQQDDNYIAARAGLGFGSKYYAGEGTVETTFKDLKIGKMGQTKVGTAGKKLLRGVQFVGNTVEAVNASIEMSHRLAAFDKAMKQMEGKGIPRREMYMIASEKAREVTVDFSNKGTGTKSLSQFVPFLGAGIAGIRQSQELIMDKDILRNTKAGHEKRMKLGRALVAGVLPSVLEAMLAGWLVFDDDDDDYLEKAEREKTKREFQGVSKYIFNNYWVFKAGDTWVRIPKDREYTAMFGTSFQTLFMKALTDDFDDGEKNWDDFVSYAGYLMTQFVPPHEFTGWALVDAKFNKTWYGSDLISEMTMGEQFTPGYYQNITDEDTNKIANVLANAIAETPFVSEPLQESLGTLATPKGIDYVMRQLGGGAAEVILPWFTPSEGAAGLIANIVGQYTTNPNKSNIYISDAYDTYDQLKAEVDFAGEDVDDRTAAWAEVFKNTMSTSSDYVTVGDLYKTIRETNANLDLSYKERMEIINGCYEDITAITSSLMAEYKKGGMPTKSSYGIVDRSAIPEWVKADGYNANEYIQYKEEFNRQLANLGGVKTNGAKNIALINANIPENYKQAFQTHLINGGDYESVKKEYEHYISAGLNVDTIVDFESNVRGSDKEWKVDARSVGLYIVGNSKYTAEEQRMLVMMNSSLSPKNQEKEYNAYVRGANAGWTPEKWYPVKMKINDLAGKYPSKADCRNAVAKLGYTGEDANIILGMYRTSWFG